MNLYYQKVSDGVWYIYKPSNQSVGTHRNFEYSGDARGTAGLLWLCFPCEYPL